MIIARYLECAYWERHERPTAAQKSNARKQVSSHIQVLKQKMGHYPWFEWVIPTERSKEERDMMSKDKKESETRRIKASLPTDLCIAWRGVHFPILHSMPPVPGPPTFGCRHRWEPRTTLHKPEVSCSNPRTTRNKSRPSFADSSHRCAVQELPRTAISSYEGLSEPTRAHFRGRAPWNFQDIRSARRDSSHLDWRCSVTFNKHKDLCGLPEDDPPGIDYHVVMKPLDDKDSEVCGHLMRVHFPAIAWAHAVSKLAAMNESWREGRREGHPSMTARQYLEQMTMCQEISSSNGNGHWEKRAIFAWTFTKARGEGEPNTWSYILGSPARNDVFEPHPGKQHEAEALVTDNFNNLYQPQPSSLSIQPISFDCLSYEPTPPLIASSHSLYTQYAHSYNSQGDLVTDAGSYMSQQSADGMGDQKPTSQQLDQYLQTDEGLSMSFDQLSQPWPGQSQTAAYDNMDNFLPPLNMLPPFNGGAGQIWDGSTEKQEQQWMSHENTYDYNPNAYGQAK